MRPTEKKIENLINNLNDQTRPELDAKILEDCYTQLNTQKPLTPAKGPTVWSTIMHSKMTKPIVAAVIIIAGFLSLTMFDKTISPAYALEQSFKAMETTTWMHIVGKRNELQHELQQECWISYPEKIVASKYSTGKITYQQDRMSYSYDKDSNKLTIHQSSADAFEFLGDSPLGFIDFIKILIKETDGEINQQTAEYLNKKVFIYNMNTVRDGSELSLEFVVDFEKELPLLLKMNQKATADQPAIEAELHFDYPSSGPQSIYAMGVPRDTIVDNKIPSDDINEILSAYSSYRNKFTSEYIAVIVNSDRSFDGLPYHADIVYSDGKTQRVESYLIAGKYQGDSNNLQEMGQTFESQYSWWRQNDKSELINVRLYDGKFYYQCRRNQQNIWEQSPKQYSPLRNGFRADDDVADLGWDVYLSSQSNDPRYTPLKIIENEYSTEHNLICLETTAQGQIVTDSVEKVWAIAPTLKRYYLNPQKDYICQRFEQEERFDAPWQEDKNWYSQVKDQEINENPCVNTIREITYIGMTEDGQWYPEEIKQWNPTDPDRSRTKNIYLKINPEFPENIFKPKTLPK
jgi:hypothetical protein